MTRGGSSAAIDTAIDSLPESSGKPWYRSKGVIGGVAAVVASIAGMVGLEISAGEIQELVAYGTAIVTAVSGAVAIIGHLLSVFERRPKKG